MVDTDDLAAPGYAELDDPGVRRLCVCGRRDIRY
jgi:hypothetical protein